MCFAMGKGGKGKRSRAETHLSVNMGSTLLLYDLSEPDNPLELAFQVRKTYAFYIQLIYQVISTCLFSIFVFFCTE